MAGQGRRRVDGGEDREVRIGHDRVLEGLTDGGNG